MTESREDLRPSIRIDPMQGNLTDSLADLSGALISLEHVRPGLLDPFKFVESEVPHCTTVRDLFEADPQKAGTVILRCEEPHHTDRLAHRMTGGGGGGRTVSWR
jgi:hypothetical protein